jgi:hypothetical protein
MKNKIILVALPIQLIGCTNSRYPNWEYVRIEEQVPAPSCVYKMQEACSQQTNTCLNWHKQRATTFNADTVVITHSEKLQNYASSAWTGRVKGGENASTVAEYYYCNGPKNIRPK